MSVRGSDLAVLTRAVLAGRLPAVRTAARGLSVPLDLAVRILALIARQEPRAFDRAAVRWVARLTTERLVSIDQVDEAVATLIEIRDGTDDGDELARTVGGWRRAVQPDERDSSRVGGSACPGSVAALGCP